MPRRPIRSIAPLAEAATHAIPRWWAAFLASLFAVSLTWRWFVLLRVARTPLLGYLGSDSQVYWDWSGLIRAGRWCGPHPFFLGPLYAYWLAGIRVLCGDSRLGVAVVQTLLGAAAVVLLADTTRRVASARAGALVGLLLAGYSMLVLFDLLVLMENLQFLLLSVFLVVLTAMASRSRGWRLPAVAGLIVGVMALGRPLALLLALPCAVTLKSTRDRRTTLASLGIFAGAIALVAAPVALHHRRVTQEWVPFTYSLGYNLYVGNGPTADGTFMPFDTVHDQVPVDGTDPEGGTAGDGRSFLLETRGLRMSAPASSRYWAALTRDVVLHDPLRALRLYGRKLVMMLAPAEVSQVVCGRVYEMVCGPLGWPMGVEFTWVAVLGLAGLIPTWRRGAAARAMVLVFLVLWCGTSVFFVVDRYRVHLVGPLVTMAGCGIESLLTAVAAGRLRAGLEWGLGAGVALVLTCAAPHDHPHEGWALASTMGEAWLQQGDARRALPYLERTAAIGDSVARGRRTGDPLLAVSVEGNANLALARERLGDAPGALESFRTALRLAPDARVLRARYAHLLCMSGRTAEAHDQFRRVGLDDSTVARAILAEALRLGARGDSTGLRRGLLAAADWEPYDERILLPVVRWEIRRGECEDARRRLDDARRHGLGSAVYAAHRAWLEGVRGDDAASSAWLARIDSDERNEPPVATTLALMGCFRRAGR